MEFSVCTVGLSPIMMSMSGVDMEKLIAVNGCRNKCCDRIMEKNGMKMESSVVIDDCVEKKMQPCEFTAVFDSQMPTKRTWSCFVETIKKAIG